MHLEVTKRCTKKSLIRKKYKYHLLHAELKVNVKLHETNSLLKKL